ncbi:type II 3-dehydroquinate dehydratase [Bacteroidota bacterium]
MKKILIINGPNLNLLGTRQPEIYGSKTFEDYLSELRKENADLVIEYYQSNIEGELIDRLQTANRIFDGIIMNAGGYTHTSVAIRDAISAIDTPVVEVHISNIEAREEFRKHSFLTAVCLGIISGFGLNSYKIGIAAIKTYLAEAD